MSTKHEQGCVDCAIDRFFYHVSRFWNDKKRLVTWHMSWQKLAVTLIAVKATLLVDSKQLYDVLTERLMRRSRTRRKIDDRKDGTEDHLHACYQTRQWLKSFNC